MYCDTSYYACKNLVYFDDNSLDCYICTITGGKCVCQGTDGNCPEYEKEEEE